MRKFPALLITFLLPTAAIAQHQPWCGFERHLHIQAQQHPDAEGHLRQISEQAEGIHHMQGARNTLIIPTVFHVIHEGGGENISRAQILDQLRILNEDFRRENADTANTREIFKPVAAGLDVEFRLAQLDPQGNCTDGIVRVYSPLTNNADDAVKAVSYWNSTRYFNVWVVKSIDNDGEAGIVLGYAQFPGFGAQATDGVVVRADRIGSIGFAVPGDAGRTLTHEAGHWLGLFHTFQGGCSGGGGFGEDIDDTPPVAAASQGCPVGANTCTNDVPDLPDQVENYMDYSNGTCMNMYTQGQVNKMAGVLANQRSNIHSPQNLALTGTDGSDPVPCAPVAGFYAESTFACSGASVVYRDDSYNGEVESRSWEFPGGSPAQSTAASPSVTYSAPGLYSATLTVSSPQGGSSFTRTDHVRIIPSETQETGAVFSEDFEDSDERYLVLSGIGNAWQKANVGFSGQRSIYINNHSGNPSGSVDEFILHSMDLTQMESPRLYFKVAHRPRSGNFFNPESNDNLKVYVSFNCGQSWTIRYNKAGSQLSTVSGTQSGAFTPSGPEQWREESITLSAFANREHLLIKFQNTSTAGNNIYIDDIMVAGVQSATEMDALPELLLFPNPATDGTELTVGMHTAGQADIRIRDITGRETALLHSGFLIAGAHTFPIAADALGGAGIYMVEVRTAQGSRTLKLAVR